jgi:hypothetical protein
VLVVHSQGSGHGGGQDAVDSSRKCEGENEEDLISKHFISPTTKTERKRKNQI